MKQNGKDATNKTINGELKRNEVWPIILEEFIIETRRRATLNLELNGIGKMSGMTGEAKSSQSASYELMNDLTILQVFRITDFCAFVWMVGLRPNCLRCVWKVCGVRPIVDMTSEMISSLEVGRSATPPDSDRIHGVILVEDDSRSNNTSHERVKWRAFGHRLF
ncbi:hypothetical protein NQ315_013978 [Exocentrus adspersus]|uniref:Uncharacterized protein n=1 Tax=Exocentrus adspersus TaxID=1586481 RepID=A0AAV8VHA6_9CUCU|nr:hypothetical protein NQ315_013978 [Exocentrus adspersus]